MKNEQLAGNPFGTFWAPFELRTRTHESRRCSMGIDLSGESQQDGSGIKRLYAFTRQGSEVQILSRLPLKDRKIRVFAPTGCILISLFLASLYIFRIFSVPFSSSGSTSPLLDQIQLRPAVIKNHRINRFQEFFIRDFDIAVFHWTLRGMAYNGISDGWVNA